MQKYRVLTATGSEENEVKMKILATALLLLAAAPTYAADVSVTSATAFADTLEEGEVVTAIRVALPGDIAATSISVKTFSVPGYDIVGTYVSDSGERNDADAQGNYVFLEFARDPVPGNDTGKTLIYFDRKNHRQDLSVLGRLNTPVDLLNGDRLVPGVFNSSGLINNLADSFEAFSFKDSTGFTVNYRLYVPPGYEAGEKDLEALPIVIFFHGGGEKGHNNDVQILGNPSALEYARPEAQARHPAYVMAPQSSNFDTPAWAVQAGTAENPKFEPSMSMAAAIEALDDVVARYNIDTDRVYGVGLSAGSRGIFISSVMQPDLYAAQINVASADVYTDEQIRGIADKPTWIILSEDETEERLTNTQAAVDQYAQQGATVESRTGENALNGFLRGSAADAQIQAQWDAAEMAGANVMFTHLRAGTVLPNPHWSWMYTFNNMALQDWLFSQSKAGN